LVGVVAHSLQIFSVFFHDLARRMSEGVSVTILTNRF
jgi:hypothetical protein